MAQFGPVHAHQAEFHGTSALATVGVLLGVAFGLSTLITPLYVIYQQSLGSSQITLTLIYAAYAIGNVAALLLFGHVSDRVGRRAAALSAIVIVATQTLESRISMMWSLTLMIPAAAAVAAAQVSGPLRVMLVTTAVVAVSAGLGYRGSLQVVNQIAPADKRAAWLPAISFVVSPATRSRSSASACCRVSPT
ncbi:MAG: putative multidrug efflux protein [Bradyrhizobium sp.]|nr:putative multidrug efflux protein [Bradyrhizobium sp.]